MRNCRSTSDADRYFRGYCGTTTDHCAAANGCQSAYGNCTGTAPKTSRDLFSVDLS